MQALLLAGSGAQCTCVVAHCIASSPLGCPFCFIPLLAEQNLNPSFYPLLQLELFRDTRESILLATQQPTVLRDMSAAARDRAFQREMRAEKNLHPALQTPEGHYKVPG